MVDGLGHVMRVDEGVVNINNYFQFEYITHIYTELFPAGEFYKYFGYS